MLKRNCFWWTSFVNAINWRTYQGYVCGFRVRVRESYSTSRSFGYGCYRTSRSSGYCGTGVQKFRAGTKGAVPVPRVLWHGVCITHRSSGYGYEYPTELTEVRIRVYKSHRTFSSSGYGYECPTEHTEVPGTGNTRVNVHPLGGEFDLKWRM